MKNLILFLALVAMPFRVIAQQLTLGPANQDEGFIPGIMLPMGASDHVVIGKVQAFSDQAFIGRYNDFGLVWAKAMVDTILVFGDQVYTVDCNFLHGSLLPNGDIVAVGYYKNNQADPETDALVVRITASGVPLWVKTYGTSTSSEQFSGVDVDPSGNIYVVGTKEELGVSREIYAKLLPDGSVAWMEEASRTDAGNRASRVCYFGDTLFVAGQTILTGSEIVGGMSNGVITMTRLSATTGQVFLHHLIGTHSNERLLDAVSSQQGIFLLMASTVNNTSPVLNSSRFLVRYGRSVFQSVTDVTELYDSFSGPGFDIGGRLAVYQNELYLSGGAIDIGIQKSYVVKSTYGSGGIVPTWGRFVTSGSLTEQVSGAALLARAGDVVLGDIKESGPSRTYVNRLTTGGSTVHPCQTVTDFTPSWVNSGLSTQGGALNVSPLSVDIIDKVIKSYVPSTTSCLSLLPLTLTSFTGEQAGKTSLLQWETVSEQGVSFFEVERQQVSGLWETLGHVNPVGGVHIAHYAWVDDAPLAGTNYYRLKIVDGGQERYSDVVAVEHDGARELRAFPNPALSGEGITVQGCSSDFLVSDHLGRAVNARLVGNQLFIDAGPGVYLLTSVQAGSLETVRVVTN